MSRVECLKKPFKLVEIPVSNFKDAAIPHHLKLLADHREIVQKECNDSHKMRSESISMKRVIAQLKGLLYELDTLRAQVEDADLDKFDMKTVSLRKTILQIISEYTELLKQATAGSAPSSKKQYQQNYENDASPESQLALLQLATNVNDLKLQEKEDCLRDVEKLHTDIQDLHSAYGTLHLMVDEQKENVDVIEENVEEAHENVTTGARHIFSASRLKASVYPVTGALVGTCIGGPLGLIVGLKVGGLAALGCGLLGFVGGKFLKKQKLGEPIVEIVHEPPEASTSTDNKSKKEE